jgi:chitinase
VVRTLAFVLAVMVGTAFVQPRLADAASDGTTVFAPYVDMVGANRALLDQALNGKLGDFTAGFVLGKPSDGCKPVWDDESTSAVGDNAVNDQIDNATHKGARVTPIVSFGGQGGFDLAITCTNQTKLNQAYQSVIDRFALTRVDFDVEGAALDGPGNSASIGRRFSAIKTLVTDNPGLQVSYTLPSDWFGLAPSGVAFLQASKAAGVKPALVNIMAMEFSDSSFTDMADATENAAEQTLAQLQQKWSSMTYRNLGVTPMAGQNINGKIFTLADAATIDEFARKTAHLGRLAMWSVNRDRSCGSGDDLSSCSKVSQQPLDFTNALLKAPK